MSRLLFLPPWCLRVVSNDGATLAWRRQGAVDGRARITAHWLGAASARTVSGSPGSNSGAGAGGLEPDDFEHIAAFQPGFVMEDARCRLERANALCRGTGLGGQERA